MLFNKHVCSLQLHSNFYYYYYCYNFLLCVSDEFESELAGAEEQLREINAFIQEKKSKVRNFLL